MPLLEVKNFSKEFVMHVRNGKKIKSVSDVSFSLEEGEFLGIQGPSGIGKSTLLKCIYRTYLPTSGSILYRSADNTVFDLASCRESVIQFLRKSEIGYVSQFLRIIPRVSAVDTVANVLRGRGMPIESSRKEARKFLSRLGIPEPLWEMFPSTYSGGEKQRVNIICAMIARPRLLLLDEPTASLDPRSREKVLELIVELKREGVAMIGVFHDKKTLAALSDTVLDLKPRECAEALS